MIKPFKERELSMADWYQPTLGFWEKTEKLFNKVIDAKPHTPVYTMAKYWARRPWNVFRELISYYTSPGDIVLDPFCGGGVTVVEGLILRRKVVGVDVNPLATYLTEMEIKPLDIEKFRDAFNKLEKELKPLFEEIYRTYCPNCGKVSIINWISWDENKKIPIRLHGTCHICGTFEKEPWDFDISLTKRYEKDFRDMISKLNLWFPDIEIPTGDKTSTLLNKGINKFCDLFTKRNLFALSLLYDKIRKLPDNEVREFLLFAFISSLKWASRMSHLRGDIIEGWAMHAYWIYPESLELNIWEIFKRRCKAVARGKSYSNKFIGSFYKPASSFDEVKNGKATCLIINQSSDELPIPDGTIDAVITDPPYGGNVNYGELSDYFLIWLKNNTMDKSKEIIINKSQGKTIHEYEKGLENVFKECFRVLKKDGIMVLTFNSKDSRVLASCVLAASRAGFRLNSDAVIYQPPIRAYQTTFHGIFVDSFIGDFILTFHKSSLVKTKDCMGLNELKERVDRQIEEGYQNQFTESMVREKIYKLLLPFLGNHSDDPNICMLATNYIEARFKELSKYFSDVRKKLEIERRMKYLKKSEERSE